MYISKTKVEEYRRRIAVINLLNVISSCHRRGQFRIFVHEVIVHIQYTVNMHFL